MLPRLVEWGLARSREVEQRGRPDKALYRLTPAGRDTLRAWVEHVEDEPAGGNAVFLLKLFFAWTASSDAALRQLDAYRALAERRLAEFEELDAGLDEGEPVHSRIALRHGIARARATLAWAVESRSLLERRPRAGARRS